MDMDLYNDTFNQFCDCISHEKSNAFGGGLWARECPEISDNV